MEALRAFYEDIWADIGLDKTQLTSTETDLYCMIFSSIPPDNIVTPYACLPNSLIGFADGTPVSYDTFTSTHFSIYMNGNWSNNQHL